jgi:hypothetical protein
MFHNPVGDVRPKVRAHCTKRWMGSRNLPRVVWPAVGALRASLSSSTALITAFRSPRTPAPLSLNTADTRAT